MTTEYEVECGRRQPRWPVVGESDELVEQTP
jgi:hypothetical protein